MSDLEFIKRIIDSKAEMILDANDKIWSYAELPYEETKSAALLCDILEREGTATRSPTCCTCGWRRRLWRTASAA